MDAMAVGGYISSVIFVDGGFCVGNQLRGFQAASSCIESMGGVQGSGHGNGRWDAEHLRPGASIARHINLFDSRHQQAES